MKLWGGRFTEGVNELVNTFNSSISLDSRMYKEDIEGSLAHVKMLGKQGIIPSEDSKKIVEGLQEILIRIDNGTIQIDKDAEDIHSFVESILTYYIGDEGKKLHTGRSRHDQVTLDTKLYLKKYIKIIINEILKLHETLLEKANENINTIMPGYTHMQKAQPITFAQLLEQIEQIEGLERIRFMTSHPKDLSDELIAVMAKSKKICRHLHLPLQSGSSRLLKIMNRHYDKEQYLTLVEKIRAAMPDIALTTDIIVGFPGETEEDFEETMDVVRKVRYDSAFTFIYSKRTGTPAAKMEDQVPEDVVKVRFDRLLKEVQEIAAEKSAVLTGQIQDVLVESVNHQDDSLLTGRLGNNSVVHFPGSRELIGQIIPVRLDECKGFYYIGSRA